MLHLYTNIEQMQAWANGNFILLGGTVWFIFIGVWDMGLIMKYPEFLMMPARKRTLPFGLSIIFLSYYYTGLFAEALKLWKGHRSFKDSVGEIIFAYMLWINTPTAIIATIYTILLP